jgi:hypothetical protein
MPSHHLGANRIVHLSGRFGRAFKPQTAHYLTQCDGREPASGSQQNSVAALLDGEFRARLPSSRIPDILRQNDLALG